MNNNLVVKEVEFNGNMLMAAQEKQTEKIYVGIGSVCKLIGLNKNQKNRQIKNIRDEPTLKDGYMKQIYDEGFGEQLTSFIDIQYLPLWLSKINTKGLNRYQYEILISMLNHCFSSEFNKLKIPTKIYQWEGELRDEIYDSGTFNGYRIIDKEVSYDFGRIDLLEKDIDDNLVVIELKKHKNNNDVIKQCEKYVCGFKNKLNKTVKIVICTLDKDNEFMRKAKLNNYEVYEYSRKLELKRLV